MNLEALRSNRTVFLLALPSVLCVFLFICRVIATGSWYYWFLIENLALAWLPLVYAYFLTDSLKTKSWTSWPNLILSFLWLIFLPNAWYVLTDFVHAVPTGQINQLYDIVLITSLLIAGFLYGFLSLLMIHRALLKRLSFNASVIIVGAVLLVSSFAIYLGRDLRWSSWDIVANPGGIALDVSDRFVHPLGHPRSWDMTGAVFLLLATLYTGIWIYLESPRQQAKSHH